MIAPVKTQIRKPKVPLPRSITGRFFVITYDRLTEQFNIVLDDADRSSHNLGTDIPQIMRQFRLWKLADIGDRTVDMAKEFGKAQAILSDGRVIPLFDKQPEKTVAAELAKVEQEFDNGRTGFIHL